MGFETVVEPVRREHAAAIQRWASDPEVARPARWPVPLPDGAAAWWIERAIAARAAGREYRFAIAEGGARGECIGLCGLAERCEGEAALSYWIGRPFWGRGHATRAGRQVLGVGFAELGLAAVRACAFDDHPATARVLAHLGFRRVHAARGIAYHRLARAEWRAHG